MVRHASLAVFLLVLMPASVEAFDHHHHHHHHSDSGCSHDSSHDDDASNDPTPTPAPTVRHRVFVTSVVQAGDLGGRRGADTLCQKIAIGRSMKGAYRAWLSDGTTSAYDAIVDAGPWYTTGDDLAFASKSDLLGAPRVALLDEYGGYPPNVGDARAWSGSDASGDATANDCDGWTRATPDTTGTTATALDGDPTWGGGHAPLACDAALPIICFEQ